MPNEMIRPCMLWGETFDLVNGLSFTIDLDCEGYAQSPVHDIALYCTLEGSLDEYGNNKYYCLDACSKTEGNPTALKAVISPFDILQLAKALNAPVKATPAVLDAMEKVPEAKYYVQEYFGDREVKYPLERSVTWNYTAISDCHLPYPSESRLTIGDYIKADCPLALQVLLQFTTEGERI